MHDMDTLPVQETLHPPLELPCHAVDPEVFFSDDPAVVEQAKVLCHSCELRAECLAGAVSRQEPHGVWGGELFADGIIIERKRPRGRPPKTPRPLILEPVVLPASPFKVA